MASGRVGGCRGFRILRFPTIVIARVPLYNRFAFELPLAVSRRNLDRGHDRLHRKVMRIWGLYNQGKAQRLSDVSTCVPYLGLG